MLQRNDGDEKDYFDTYNTLIKDLRRMHGTSFTINANPKGCKSLYFLDVDFGKDKKLSQKERKDILDDVIQFTLDKFGAVQYYKLSNSLSTNYHLVFDISMDIQDTQAMHRWTQTNFPGISVEV